MIRTDLAVASGNGTGQARSIRGNNWRNEYSCNGTCPAEGNEFRCRGIFIAADLRAGALKTEGRVFPEAVRVKRIAGSLAKGVLLLWNFYEPRGYVERVKRENGGRGGCRGRARALTRAGQATVFATAVAPLKGFPLMR